MAWISEEQAAELVGSTVRLGTFVTFHFASETSRVWSGASRIRLDGVVWSPIAGRISGLDTPRTPESSAVTFTLSGVTGEIVATALKEREEVKGRFVDVRLRLFDANWGPIGPFLPPVFRGIMQRVRVSRSEGEEPSRVVSVEAENMWESRARQPAGRFNDADQNTRFPGDKAFRFVSAQSERPAVWPKYS